jgi:hypothetical protein
VAFTFGYAIAYRICAMPFVPFPEWSVALGSLFDYIRREWIPFGFYNIIRIFQGVSEGFMYIFWEILTSLFIHDHQ